MFTVASSITFPTSLTSVRNRHRTSRIHRVASPIASSTSSSSLWKQVIDPKSAQPYYWNTKTNQTSWEIPEDWKQERHDGVNYDDDDETAMGIQDSSKVPIEDLTNVLLKAIAVDSSKFGDVANQYRPQCFDDDYFEYLTNIINSTQDNEEREAFVGLRARLANPLLKNPPPY